MKIESKFNLVFKGDVYKTLETFVKQKQFKNIVLSDRKVKNKLDQFLQSTRVLDNHYGMSFKDANPEMYEIIERLVNVD